MTLKLNGSTGGSVSIDAPAATTGNADITFSLPVADGSNGQVLQTNGSGQLSFASASSDNITEGNTSVEVVDTGSNGEVRFTTEGTRAATIDSSRRLLVGTSTSVGVVGAGSYTPNVQIARNANANLGLYGYYADAAGDGATLIFTRSRSNTVGTNTIVQSGDELGAIWFAGANGTGYDRAALIKGEVDGTPGSSGDMPGRLVFSTTADGASSPTARLTLYQNGSAGFLNTKDVYPGTDNFAPLGVNGLRWSAVWAANGTIQTSDERAKTDIADAQLGSDFIKTLRPVSYKWIEGGKRDTGERDEDNNYIYESVPGQRTHWGFIAQEVKQAVDDAGVDFGGWVLTDKDDPDSEQALRYDQFIAPLTKALQEALAEIESLKTRLTALEGGTN